VDVRLTDGPRAGETAKTALLPFTMNGQRLGAQGHPPHRGADTEALLLGLGLSSQEVQRLRESRAVA
jgi:crotonobetainyl-CoA:carnitine CoA-transferase CaiB-like acyl-CoA transferase